MRSPPPRGKILLIGSEDIEVYPQYCGDSHRCVQCYFNGKYLCAPRYWLYPTQDGYPGYPPATKSMGSKVEVSLSSVNRDGEALESRFAGHPLIEMPDGGFVAEATGRVMNRPIFTRKEPYRITDVSCYKCGYPILNFYSNGSLRNNYRVKYNCPQCGSDQTKDTQRKPYIVKPLLRELREQGVSVRVTKERIQQELGVTIGGDTYYRLLREMGLPLTRKFERRGKGINTVAQIEAAKRNILKTRAHRVKALREALF